MKNAKNLVAALFRLEQSMENRDILAIVEELLTWLAMPDQQSLSRAMAAWMDRVMRPSKPDGADIPAFSDLTEVQSMLRETVQEWYREAEEKGEARGKTESRQDVARRMKARGMDLQTIAELTDLSIDDINNL